VAAVAAAKRSHHGEQGGSVKPRLAGWREPRHSLFLFLLFLLKKGITADPDLTDLENRRCWHF